MQYLITFLEGIISFISPCMLPLLPVYLSFFAGDSGKPLPRASAFVLGFTAVFCALGVFAGALGGLLNTYRTAVNIVCGAVVIVFGLSYLEIIPLNFFRGMRRQSKVRSVLSAFVFGVVYSVSLTPCVGAFLGSAIMLASVSASAMKGFALLLIYSLGLGLPFVLSALLIDRLQNVFGWIKRHYGIINRVSGALLIALGILMALGVSLH